jgi:GT2 family glycosyltransferase
MAEPDRGLETASASLDVGVLERDAEEDDADIAGAPEPERARRRPARSARTKPSPEPAAGSEQVKGDGLALPTAARPRPRRLPAPAVTATFRGSFASLRLREPAHVVAVMLDDCPLKPDAWKPTGDRALRVECPPNAFDSRPHALRLLRDGEAPDAPDGEADVPERLVVTFASEYRGWIDSVDEHTLRGWVFDRLRPDSALVLEVRSGDGPAVQAVCEIERLDVKPTEPLLVGGGFEVALQRRAAHAVPELLIITVQGSGYRPFPPMLRGAELAAAVTAASEAARALGRTPAGLLLGSAVVPSLAGALIGSAPLPPDTLPGTLRLWGARTLVRGTAPTIDIVIPVYAGEAETLACIESVLASGSRLKHRVVVIDDCSPEPSLSHALRALERAGRIVYARNERNLGFVRSANFGMSLDADADVVLLNADTIVPAGFLDRLYRAAYSDPAIATVTPLSNNATIFNLPTIDGAPQPWRMETAEIDALCQAANAGEVRDVPTAHGFCMYVKRTALDDVGHLDAETFGTGYGEENDFSVRAWLRGWRNVAAGDVFVTHIGSVSFKEARAQLVGPNLERLRQRHPFYPALIEDFFRTDPLHALRNNVQKALWRRAGRIAVVITLGLGGGTVQHAEDMMARLTEEGWLALMFARGTGSEANAPHLRRWRSDEALTYPAQASLAERLSDILDLQPRMIHLQHLIDLPDGVGEFVRESGIPYAVTLHDFFYGCPKVTMLDAGGGYCGMPPASKCTLCVRQGPIHPDMHPALRPYAEVGEIWRGKWDGLLRDAAQVIAPSRDTAERYARLFPGLPVTVRPHFAPHRRQKPRRGALPAVEDAIRVALIGALGPQKGAAQFVELARHCSLWHDDLHFVVVGLRCRRRSPAPSAGSRCSSACSRRRSPTRSPRRWRRGLCRSATISARSANGCARWALACSCRPARRRSRWPQPSARPRSKPWGCPARRSTANTSGWPATTTPLPSPT